GRVIHRDHARDDWTLVQCEAEAVAELQPEGCHLVREAEFRRLRPYAAALIGAHARLDELDRPIGPLTSLLVGVVLPRRGAAGVEGRVIAGAIADEALQDVEERLVARADHAVGEVMWMRIAALARDGIDRLSVIGAVAIENLVGLGDDVVLA